MIEVHARLVIDSPDDATVDRLYAVIREAVADENDSRPDSRVIVNIIETSREAVS